MVKKIKKKSKKSTKMINPVRRFQGTQEIKEENKVSDEIKKTKIRVIGIGGGGGTIVSEIALQIPKATFVVANTDLQALRTSGRKVNRFQFGQSLTHGLGTGMNAELGREAALNEKERIGKLCRDQDLCVIVACLGGGTGSGAAPVFAKISKSFGGLTYGIFTLPFKFEGEKKMEIAKEALKRIKNHLNVITLIPNERIFQTIDKATPLKQALSVINKSLAKSLGGLIEVIYEPGLINIDFADFKTILEGRGKLAYLNTVEVPRKEGSTKDLIAQVINSSLYPYTIRGAKGVLFNIAGEKNLSLFEVNQISKIILELANPEAKIIFGISQSQKYLDTVKITLLAVDCGKKKMQGSLDDESQRTRAAKKEKKSEGVKAEKRKQKKIKIKIVKKPEERMPAKPLIQKSGDTADFKTEAKLSKATDFNREAMGRNSLQIKKEAILAFPEGRAEGKIRKNALQVKKEIEEVEKEIEAREKIWEVPAFLRRKTKS